MSALCQWKDGCRATAEVKSEAGVYCSLHAALRDAADETTVTWRALARAAAPIAVVIALFMLAPGCGGQHTTDDAAWVGIVAGAFALALFIGGAIGWRLHRRECGCDPEMPEVQL